MNLIMFAQGLEEVSHWHLGLAAGVVIILLFAAWLYREVFVRKPPLEAEFASNERVDKLEEAFNNKHNALRNEIKKDLAEIIREGGNRETALRQSIENVHTGLNNRLDQTVEHLDEKIDAMPSRMIDILNKTGAIGGGAS